MDIIGLSGKVGLDASGLTEGLGKAERETQEFSRNFTESFNDLADVVGGIFARIKGAALEYGRESVEAFKEADEASARLGLMVEKLGQQYGITRGDIESLAESLHESTRAEDDHVRSVASQLIPLGLRRDVLLETIKVGNDMAALFGGDLSSSAISLGQALANPEMALNRFRRQGLLAVTDDMEKLVKKFVEAGDVASAQQFILSQLDAKYSGTAEAMDKTITGSLDRMNKELSDAKEMFGEQLAPAIAHFVSQARPLLGGLTGSISLLAAEGSKALALLKGDKEGAEIADYQVKAARATMRASQARLVGNEHEAKFADEEASQALDAARGLQDAKGLSSSEVHRRDRERVMKAQQRQQDIAAKEAKDKADKERAAAVGKETAANAAAIAKEFGIDPATVAPVSSKKASAGSGGATYATGTGAGSSPSKPLPREKETVPTLIVDADMRQELSGAKRDEALALYEKFADDLREVMKPKDGRPLDIANVQATLSNYRMMFDKVKGFSKEAFDQIERDAMINAAKLAKAPKQLEDFYRNRATRMVGDGSQVFTEQQVVDPVKLKEQQAAAREKTKELDAAALDANMLRSNAQVRKDGGTEAAVMADAIQKARQQGGATRDQIKALVDLRSQAMATYKQIATSTGETRQAHIDALKVIREKWREAHDDIASGAGKVAESEKKALKEIEDGHTRTAERTKRIEKRKTEQTQGGLAESLNVIAQQGAAISQTIMGAFGTFAGGVADFGALLEQTADPAAKLNLQLSYANAQLQGMTINAANFGADMAANSETMQKNMHSMITAAHRAKAAEIEAQQEIERQARESFRRERAQRANVADERNDPNNRSGVFGKVGDLTVNLTANGVNDPRKLVSDIADIVNQTGYSRAPRRTPWRNAFS